MEEKQEYIRIKLGGLWEHTTKNGNKFWSGDFTYGSSIQIWPNKKREGTKDPDYTVFITEKPKKTENKSQISERWDKDQVMTFPPNTDEIPF